VNGHAALAVATIAVPAAAGLVGLLVPYARRGLAAGLAITATAFGFVAAVILATWGHAIETSRLWVRFGSLDVTAGVHLDRGLAYVAIAVTGVALAVQVYSVAYLDHDDRYPPYAAQVSLFTAAMLLVVMSSDLILLLVGWEVMGICSYLLIAHDRALPDAPAAAVKAFVVTRFGDVGFLLGIALLGVHAGTFRIATILRTPTSAHLLTIACALLLLGAIGKSAQFPLHTWLPDAMAGPTPISALIHAATMVAAGVIVLVRLAPLFAVAPGLLAAIGVIACVTMLLGACAAMAQDDIKRVLAWSTVSQVAYMFAGFAVNLRGEALFHMLTHAAFKAVLFLCAGCVIHAIGTNSMTEMGGLRRSMPVTFATMTIGLAALAGVPPFSGFFSKDAILGAAWEAAYGRTGSPAWIGVLVLVVGLITAALTAWYATRLWLRTFFGAYRGGDGQPHDPPPLMRWPVLILSIPAALLGFAWLSGSFRDTLAGPIPAADIPVFDAATVISLVMVAIGVLGAWALWRRDTAADPARMLGAVRPAFANAFYLDAVQNTLVVRPVYALASLVRRGDAAIVDGAVEGAGTSTMRIGGWFATWHRGALPRAATAVLGGAVLIAIAAVIVGGL
jgi:NADH-quinone oxidoreductase subunit L